MKVPRLALARRPPGRVTTADAACSSAVMISLSDVSWSAAGTPGRRHNRRRPHRHACTRREQSFELPCRHRSAADQQDAPAFELEEDRIERHAVTICGATTFSMGPSDGAFNVTSEGVTASVDTTGWAPGRHLILVEGQDADGNWGAPTGVFLDVE
jgi:hypothetical protein